MDKETLSNYGWIVICVLVLAVMIALATPFGSFVSAAVQSTTQGLFDVNQSALNSAGVPGLTVEDQEFDVPDMNTNGGAQSNLIPEGGTYYVGVSVSAVGDYTSASATYTAGDPFPETVNNGDVYVYGDYEYRRSTYNVGAGLFNGYLQYGWGVRVIDSGKTVYGPLLDSINGQPVTNLTYTFWGCANLTTAPTIPDSVQSLYYTFGNCTALKTYVGNQDAYGDFSGYNIPNSVTGMTGTFQGCTSLEIAPSISSNVTSMVYTFLGCTALTDASNVVIPSSVTKITGTFEDCTSLTGTIMVNANPQIWSRCLYNTKVTAVVGSTTMADDIMLTKTSDAHNPTA